MITITNKSFQPVDWPGDAISYQNGCVLDKYTAVIEFYIEKKFLGKRLYFNGATKKISNYNNIDAESFIDAGFIVGETIIIEHTGVNNQGEFTITEVADRYIVVSESVTTEIAEGCDVYLTSKITDLDFYANLIPLSFSGRHKGSLIVINNPSKRETNGLFAPRTNGIYYDFTSLTDKNTQQKYVATGLDCEVATPVYFEVETESWGWVPENITTTTTTTKIEGVALSGYKQKFKITHKYYIAPFYLPDHAQNMENRKPPLYFAGENCLSYAFKIDGRYDDSIVVDSVAGSADLAKTCWFNQNVKKSRTEYYVDSIAYVDSTTSDSVDMVDLNRTTNVTIVVKSRSGLFTTGSETGSKFVITHLLCPNDETSFVDTETNLLQNFLTDRAIRRAGQVKTNGASYGTDYQCITDYQVVRDDASTVTITCKITYSTYIKTLLAAREDNDRYYALIITTQNVATTTADGIDRVAMIADYQNMSVDTNDSSLLLLDDYIHCKRFPFETEYKSINGYEGERWCVKVPMQLYTASQNPRFKTVAGRVIARKTNYDDAVIEEKIFNCEGEKIVDDVQQIDFSVSRGYKIPEGDWNVISFATDSTYNDTNKVGFLLTYALVLRDESWQELSNLVQGSDLQKTILAPTNNWASLIAEGWNLYFQMEAVVLDENDVATTFKAETTIVSKLSTAAPDEGATLTPDTYLLDEDGYKIDSIKRNGTTKIVTVFTGDLSGITPELIVANLTMDKVNGKGGQNKRIEINTETDTEIDGFEAPAADPNSNTSWANSGMRVDVYDESIIVSTLYTQKDEHFGFDPCAEAPDTTDEGDTWIVIGIGNTISLPVGETRLFDDLTDHYWPDSSPSGF